MKKIEVKHGLSSSTLDEILRTHLIEPEFLRKNDFKGFYQQRKEALSGLIEQAMGKPVVREPSRDDVEPDDPEYVALETGEQSV